MPAGAVVDTGELLRVVAAAFVAGIGVTAVFSLAIAGAVRFVDERRAGRSGPAVVYGLLAAVALIACAAAVAAGIFVMTQK